MQPVALILQHPTRLASLLQAVHSWPVQPSPAWWQRLYTLPGWDSCLLDLSAHSAHASHSSTPAFASPLSPPASASSNGAFTGDDLTPPTKPISPTSPTQHGHPSQCRAWKPHQLYLTLSMLLSSPGALIPPPAWVALLRGRLLWDLQLAAASAHEPHAAHAGPLREGPTAHWSGAHSRHTLRWVLQLLVMALQLPAPVLRQQQGQRQQEHSEQAQRLGQEPGQQEHGKEQQGQQQLHAKQRRQGVGKRVPDLWLGAVAVALEALTPRLGLTPSLPLLEALAPHRTSIPPLPLDALLHTWMECSRPSLTTAPYLLLLRMLGAMGGLRAWPDLVWGEGAAEGLGRQLQDMEAEEVAGALQIFLFGYSGPAAYRNMHQ